MECDGYSSDILVGVLSFHYHPGPPITPLSRQNKKFGATDRFQSGELFYTSVYGNREWICKTIGERNMDLC